MNWKRTLKQRVTFGATALVSLLALAGTAAAQEAGGGITTGQGLQALGAGLAVGLAGLATAIAQQDIGSSAVGAIAEDSDLLGPGILMVAIPETIVILGFVIAFLLMP